MDIKGMGNTSNKYEIRASFDKKTITIYQAFSKHIALPAIKHNRLVAPFSFDRMTWIKPSLGWMIYRSDWARNANQEFILSIQVSRKKWEEALREAILTTPELHVYASSEIWRKQADKARIKVQWDPERSLKNEKLPYSSIQVGIAKSLIEAYATQWIVNIDDCTPLIRKIHNLCLLKRIDEATALLPLEKVYPTPMDIQKQLGM